MGQYTRDGGVIPSGIPTSQRSYTDHFKLFGVYRGMIVKVVYPEDKKNQRGDRVEYTVRVNGQDYSNAIDVTAHGGIFNYGVTVRKEITESTDNKIKPGTNREKMNGEVVFVMFVNGHGDVPLIIGSDQHPRNTAGKKISKDKGIHSVEEFNGVEFSIDKDSNYTIEQVGRKDDKGQILNQDAVKSQIKIFGETGDIEINTHKTEGTADLRMRLTKESKKMEFYAQENKVVYDENGISLIDKNNNEFTFTDQGMSMKSVKDLKSESAENTEMVSQKDFKITSTQNFEVQATQQANIQATQKATMQGITGTDVGIASSVTNVDGSIVRCAGGATPVAKMGSLVVGTGNLGLPIVASILTGSPRVLVP